MTAPTLDDLFAVMARASCGEVEARVELDSDADLCDPRTRLGLALNVLLDDLAYRHDQARSYLRELIEQQTRSLEISKEEIRRREEFISIAGHELNTPLMSLTLMLDGVRRGLIGDNPAQMQRAVALAERQVRKLGLLVETLLGAGRSSSGHKVRLQLAQEDLVAIARDAAEVAGLDLARAGIPLTIHAPGPIVGRWDRNRLEQVFANVIANAIKFGRGKPIELTIIPDREVARVTIVDHGIGIPPERLPFMFNLFERGVSSDHYGGLGLGLFVVREIIAAHAGTVAVASEPGAGTTITFELPLGGPPLVEVDGD